MSPQHPALVCRSAAGGLFQPPNNWAEPRVVLPAGGMRLYQKMGNSCLLPAPHWTTAPRSGELVETALPGDSGVSRAFPLHTNGYAWGDTHVEGDVQVQMRLLDLPVHQGDVMGPVCTLQLDGHLDRLTEATEMDPQHRCVGVVDHSWGRDHITSGKEKC